MSEYTPDTENIRQTFAYVQAGLDDDEGYPFVMHVHVAEFDRWLASVKAEAWHEGAKTGYLTRGNPRAPIWANPYRGEQV